jgi:ribosomal protein S18 acetylase RimI-like enzyme
MADSFYSYFRKIAVRTWHLHYRNTVPIISENVTVLRWIQPDSKEYLSLYKRVGELWGWTGRLLLSSDELHQKLNDPLSEVWLFSTEGTVKGFFEIDRSEKGRAEIVYLGLLPEMIGKGLGKSFLETAVAIASGEHNDQVWLHTCTYDHPNALGMYLKAGFIIEKETIEQEYYSKDFLQKHKK